MATVQQPLWKHNVNVVSIVIVDGVCCGCCRGVDRSFRSYSVLEPYLLKSLNTKSILFAALASPLKQPRTTRLVAA